MAAFNNYTKEETLTFKILSLKMSIVSYTNNFIFKLISTQIIF